ncbi:hypothetical protein I7X12_05695 [Halosimplex litoreum]|jgi:hypothetical protein|uniref:Uncharacterized protein n=1 Tax=Halosimplex litoreum TaxID=1198301 RepID=A0A7T3G0S3_9EURY|nr:hypothetical protein [Halosimplex litoreum]QPV64117.1 hypothetical protein I7X12_05695 [Halosimplex litoreum]
MFAAKQGSGRGRTWLQYVLIAAVALFVLTGAAAAQDSGDSGDSGDSEDDTSAEDELTNQIRQIADFLSVVIFAVAVPNGAYGLFEYMTAGTDTESTQKGKKRIRNSFVAVAGVGVIQVAVRFLGSLLGLTA